MFGKMSSRPPGMHNWEARVVVTSLFAYLIFWDFFVDSASYYRVLLSRDFFVPFPQGGIPKPLFAYPFFGLKLQML